MQIIKYPEKGRFSLEGVIIEWKKAQGDTVKKGDLLLQIEAAGELLEVESPIDGTLLKIPVGAGSYVKAGQELAIIGQKGEDPSKILTNLQTRQSAPVKEHPKRQAPKTESKSKTQPQVTHTKEEVMTSDSSANVIPILMPQAGQSMEEGTVLSWKIKEGDPVEVGQVIMEIETDKATMEVEATDAGTVVKIVAAEGAVVPVKQPVAYIAENAADVEAYLSGSGSISPAAEIPASKKEGKKETKQPEPVSSLKSEPVQASAPPAQQGDVIPVLMPQAGQSMEEGTILSWKVREGDRIEVGQVIMEIETDKATMEVEAADAGRIARIVAKEGDVVAIKKPVAYLAEEGVTVDASVGGTGTASDTPKTAVAAPTPAKETPAQKAASDDSGRTKASPAARKAAQEKGVDLDSVAPGSGPGGRVLSTDVQAAGVTSFEGQARPLTKMRRAIARNLSYSKQTIPHFYAKKTIDAGLLFSTYRKTKEQFKCSVNDFVTYACAKAIRQYPAFRSRFNETEIIEKPAVNIGIAVGTDEGLTVPVVLNADTMNLEQVAAQTRKVVESARNGKLEGLGQGIFTISNMGMFGVEEFSAIINPPESAILAVGAIREGVIVEKGAIRAGRLMTMVLSVDHRVIDGVMAVQFLNTLQELLEAPEQLVS